MTGKKNKIKIGFSLAEILFAITIIGVIAALTIPDLILNVQKQQYVAALKRIILLSVKQLNKQRRFMEAQFLHLLIILQHLLIIPAKLDSFSNRARKIFKCG